MSKILVIDDDELFRLPVVEALRSKSFEVVEAEDGATGVKMAKAQLPNLIISDVIMGGMDGYKVVDQLRRDPLTCTVPIILMTHKADFAGLRQGMGMGADDYLPKPFDMEQLFKSVEARLHKQENLLFEADQKMRQLRDSISMLLPHELLTPLNGIVGLSELMAASPQDFSPDEITEMARDINTSGHQLHALFKNYLVYAQIELLANDPAKCAELRRGVTLDAEAAVCAAAEKKAASLGRSGDLFLETVSTRAGITREHLEKIVEELVDNAFKFSPSGSAVIVHLSFGGSRVALHVADRGRGMEPQHLKSIGGYMQFERRIQGQAGSGLGLEIARRLAELHGGGLSIQSQRGLGTRVEVSLPR